MMPDIVHLCGVVNYLTWMTYGHIWNDLLNITDMDEEFIKVMFKIEETYQTLNKHQKIRVEAWTKKLCQVTTNEVWKKNRNLYARILLN